MRAHDPAPAQRAGWPREIAFTKSQAGQYPLRLWFKLPSAVLVENMKGSMISLVGFPITSFMPSDQLLRLDQLGRDRHREFKDRPIPCRGGFLGKKSERGAFLERDLAG